MPAASAKCEKEKMEPSQGWGGSVLSACQKSLFYGLHQWILLVKGFPLRESWQP